MAMNSLSANASNPSPPTSGYAVYQAHKRQRLEARHQDQQPNAQEQEPTNQTLDEDSKESLAKKIKTSTTASTASSSNTTTTTMESQSTGGNAPGTLSLTKEQSWSTVLENVNVDNFGGIGPMPPMNNMLEKRTSSQFSIGSLLPTSNNNSTALPGMNMNVPMTTNMNMNALNLNMNPNVSGVDSNNGNPSILASAEANGSNQEMLSNNMNALNGAAGNATLGSGDMTSAMAGAVSPGNMLSTSSTKATLVASATTTSSSTTSGDYMYPENVKPMTFSEKQRLVQKITLLPGQYLRGLMDVISKYQPDTVRQIDDDGYAFDLGQMNENTVWAINDYVKESMMELDGYMKTVASANFSLDNGSGADAQSMGTLVTQHQLTGGVGKALQPHVQRDGNRHHHPSIQMPVNPVKMSAIYQNENQNKFMEQVEMYSKPKVTKSRVKPSKKHECPTCSKQFRGRSELQNHIRTHTGEKPLKCSYAGCNKRYAHSSNLRAHERSHAGVKPYACHYDGCGKSFAHSVSLKEHIWMHAGFQPYECPYEGCGKKFTQVSNFARHKKTHEKEEVQRPAENEPEGE